MDTKPLKTFAQSARRQLHTAVAAQLDRVLRTDSGALRAKSKIITELKERIAATSRQEVIETVAYTWFNRFCALRYMDVKNYTRVGTVSPAPAAGEQAFTQPQILQEAKEGHIDAFFEHTLDAPNIFGLLNGRRPSDNPQQEAYRLLLVGVCNAYHSVMPFLFEKIADYSELLMPDDLLSENSILQALRDALTPEVCADVEVLGWLYQFYISEKKDAVMARKSAVPSEDIPAVTQLFTPHWIVRYMVENSLGRLWMLNHPGSRLVEKMDYYIAPEQEIDDFLRVSSPEEIRLCDPAAGSGHILTYAFDLLTAIYEEQGYNPVEIPRLILKHNLSGIEIDARAGALASFALLMKARAADRRVFRRKVLPDICVLENVRFAPDELDAYVDALGRDLFTQDVRDWLQQFEQAKTFGALIRPLVSDSAFIRARLDEVGVFQDLFLSATNEKLRTLLRMSEALSPRYHVVVANPPYLGSKGMNPALKAFAKDYFPDSKSDLCVMFIERNLDLVQPKGWVSMITMQSWMFLSSFEKMRKNIVQQEIIETMTHLGPRAFDSIGGEVVSTTAFTLRHEANLAYKGQYFRLIDGNSEAEKAQMLSNDLQADNWQLTMNYYRASAADFKKIPGAPIAYWVSKSAIRAYTKGKLLGDVHQAKSGVMTGNDSFFLRNWHEIEHLKIGFGYEQENAVSHEWLPMNKESGFRKWSGRFVHVLHYIDHGKNFSDEENLNYRLRDTELWFKAGISWGDVTSSTVSFRYQEPGLVFAARAPMIYTLEKSLAAFLNSNSAAYFQRLINPTLSFNLADLYRLPLLNLQNTKIEELVTRLVKASDMDWNSQETSWDFTTLPLLDTCAAEPAALPAAYLALRANWQAATAEMQRLEEENNRIFIDAYGLQDELTPNVPLNEITLTCNPHYRYGSSSLKARAWDALSAQFPECCARLAAVAAAMAPQLPESTRLGLEQRLLDDTMREFISYAVGCMFGRYSLDKPGLLLANQGQTLDDYLRQVPDPTFTPVADNVIPILDRDSFTGDISARFKTFLGITFGAEHLAENLTFVEAAIGRDIRSYFLRDFYADHVKRYKKRPIYWLFSSPKGGFNALVAMHRYRPDTPSIVLNSYLREFRGKLSARKQHLESISISSATAARDKNNALKEIAKIEKLLRELQHYENDTLYPLATRQPEIDLDDGVKVNYNKFGAALKRVPGLSEK